MTKNTKIVLRLAPRQVRPFSMDGVDRLELEATLACLGCQFPAAPLAELRRAVGYSMDAAGPEMVTLAGAGTPGQFLQHLLPGAIQTVTGARKIDKLVGRTIAGKWSDEEIVQTVVEYTGQVRPYGDSTSGPLGSFNVAFEKRNVVRFEGDLEVTVLEEERAAAIRQNSGEHKRAAVSGALAIELNRVGFYGYNDGEVRTYGFLNDPGLPSYKTLPAGASGSTKWADKTFLEITRDLRLAAASLRAKTKELVEPEDAACTLAVSSAVREHLHTVNELGVSVMDWLKKTYPKWTVQSAPELDGASGGANVFYLYAQEVPGAGEDGMQKVVEQYVPAVLRLIGVERRAKGPYEVYSNATSGVMFQVPVAVERYAGV